MSQQSFLDQALKSSVADPQAQLSSRSRSRRGFSDLSGIREYNPYFVIYIYMYIGDLYSLSNIMGFQPARQGSKDWVQVDTTTLLSPNVRRLGAEFEKPLSLWLSYMLRMAQTQTQMKLNSALPPNWVVQESSEISGEPLLWA